MWNAWDSEQKIWDFRQNVVDFEQNVGDFEWKVRDFKQNVQDSSEIFAILRKMCDILSKCLGSKMFEILSKYCWF